MQTCIGTALIGALVNGTSLSGTSMIKMAHSQCRGRAPLHGTSLIGTNLSVAALVKQVQPAVEMDLIAPNVVDKASVE